MGTLPLWVALQSCLGWEPGKQTQNLGASLGSFVITVQIPKCLLSVLKHFRQPALFDL